MWICGPPPGGRRGWVIVPGHVMPAHPITHPITGRRVMCGFRRLAGEKPATVRAHLHICLSFAAARLGLALARAQRLSQLLAMDHSVSVDEVNCEFIVNLQDTLIIDPSNAPCGPGSIPGLRLSEGRFPINRAAPLRRGPPAVGASQAVRGLRPPKCRPEGSPSVASPTAALRRRAGSPVHWTGPPRRPAAGTGTGSAPSGQAACGLRLRAALARRRTPAAPRGLGGGERAEARPPVSLAPPGERATARTHSLYDLRSDETTR